MIELNKILFGDCLEVINNIPDNSIDCCVTSPPYFGLRDYGVDGQIGLEETPEQYVQKLVKLFNEVKRCLKQEGTLWLNLGDSYYGSGRGSGGTGEVSKKQVTNRGANFAVGKKLTKYICDDCKPKDLIGIPWIVAFALRADGWYLRQDIIWSKPNPMPESVTDRCTKSHEYIFLLSKSAKYYFDQDSIKQPVSDTTVQRLSQQIEHQKGSGRVPFKTNGNMKAVGQDDKANKRSVWIIPTMPFPEAHFATFPELLISDCIKAGCPENGIVLDPFMGSGTTGLVARKLNRNYIGIELNPEYIKIAERRIFNEIGLFI